MTKLTRRGMFSCALLLGTLTVTSAARAQDAYPAPNAARPSTLSALTLRVDAQLSIGRAVFCIYAGPLQLCEGDTFARLSAGAGFGITDDLEVGALYLLPIQFAPDADFLNPRLYGRYRFLDGDVELSVQLGLTIPFQGVFAFDVGVPAWVHINADLVLRSGLTYAAVASNPVIHTLAVPLELVGQITPEIFVGGGIDPTLVFGSGSAQLVLPLGVHGGYTFASGGAPVADVQLGFSFPEFLHTGDGGATALSVWQILLTGRIYAFL